MLVKLFFICFCFFHGLEPFSECCQQGMHRFCHLLMEILYFCIYILHFSLSLDYLILRFRKVTTILSQLLVHVIKLRLDGLSILLCISNWLLLLGVLLLNFWNWLSQDLLWLGLLHMSWLWKALLVNILNRLRHLLRSYFFYWMLDFLCLFFNQCLDSLLGWCRLLLLILLCLLVCLEDGFGNNQLLSFLFLFGCNNCLGLGMSRCFFYDGGRINFYLLDWWDSCWLLLDLRLGSLGLNCLGNLSRLGWLGRLSNLRLRNSWFDKSLLFWFFRWLLLKF